MPREWNTTLALSLALAAFMAGFNIWYLTQFTPLDPLWTRLILICAFGGVIVCPLLAYAGVRYERTGLILLSFLLLALCIGPGVVLRQNGVGDDSPIVLKPGKIIDKETGKTKAGNITYALRARVDGERGEVRFGCSRDMHARIPIGTPVDIPTRAGRLGIGWHVTAEDVTVHEGR